MKLTDYQRNLLKMVLSEREIEFSWCGGDFKKFDPNLCFFGQLCEVLKENDEHFVVQFSEKLAIDDRPAFDEIKEDREEINDRMEAYHKRKMARMIYEALAVEHLKTQFSYEMQNHLDYEDVARCAKIAAENAP